MSARLGIVISMFPELHETFILRELAALERRGVDFDIFSLQHPRDPITLDDAIRLAQQRTHYAPLLNAPALAALLRAVLRNPLRVLGSVARLSWDGRDRPLEVLKNLAILPLSMRFAELGRQRGITHWHGHWANVPTTLCWYLARIHGARYSAAIHGEDIFTANRFLATKLDDAAFTVVCSGYFQSHLQSALSLRAPERVHLNYHGLDPRVLERAAEPRTSRRPGTPLRLVSIGRLVPTKGHDTLLRALASLRDAGGDARLEIIGSGPEGDALQQLTRALDLEGLVQFTGGLPFDSVIDRLLQADVFCLAPRLIDGQPPDGIPNVIAEAMALGLPVVTTRVSAIPELVEDEVSGCLVPVDDSEAMAQALRSLSDDGERAVRLSTAARARVAGLFDQDANIDELLGYFERHVPGQAIAYARPPTRDAAFALPAMATVGSP